MLKKFLVVSSLILYHFYSYSIDDALSIKWVQHDLITELNFNFDKKEIRTIKLEKDFNLSSDPKNMDVKKIAYVKGKFVVIVDAYWHNIEATGPCAGGEESYLRVISLSNKNLKETYKTYLTSCYNSIELPNGDEAKDSNNDVIWDEKNNSIIIKWGYNPKKEDIAETILKINPDGKVTEVDRK